MSYFFAFGRRWGDYILNCLFRRHKWNKPYEIWTGWAECTRYKDCKNCGGTIRC